MQLQRRVEDTENRIALARGYYNEIVTDFNTRLAVWPDRFLGRLAGMHPESTLSAAGFERKPLVVHLAQ